MRLPNFVPPTDPRAEFVVLGEYARIAKYGVNQRQNFRTGAPRLIQRTNAELFGRAGLVTGFQPIEQRRIAASPLINRLLGITHAKQRSLPLRILHHFVNQVFENAPLHPACVLKFIQQPMVELAVETILDVQPDWPTTSEARPILPRSQQHREIRKCQSACAPDLFVIMALKQVEQTVDSFCPHELEFQLTSNEMAQHLGQETGEQVANLVRFFVVTKLPATIAQSCQTIQCLLKDR